MLYGENGDTGDGRGTSEGEESGEEAVDEGQDCKHRHRIHRDCGNARNVMIIVLQKSQYTGTPIQRAAIQSYAGYAVFLFLWHLKHG